MKERGKRGKCRRDSLSGVPDGTWLEDWRDGENEREREAVEAKSEEGTREYPVAPGSFESDAQ